MVGAVVEFVVPEEVAATNDAAAVAGLAAE